MTCLLTCAIDVLRSWRALSSRSLSIAYADMLLSQVSGFDRRLSRFSPFDTFSPASEGVGVQKPFLLQEPQYFFHFTPHVSDCHAGDGAALALHDVHYVEERSVPVDDEQSDSGLETYRGVEALRRCGLILFALFVFGLLQVRLGLGFRFWREVLTAARLRTLAGE